MALLLQKAMVATTVFDMEAILNLPIYSKEPSSLYTSCCVPLSTIGFKFSKNDSGYLKFVHINGKKSGIVTSIEHNASLWMCF
ncbi:hypothetical protein GmHk_08G023502 [Glycine max]|nr:hypothetical protein GmHk_08G023502 [Glycine max]